MNTDNMSIAARAQDYDPCAFMDVYHAGTVYSSIDTVGRYAYGNQPAIARWNLVRFAETLLPLLTKDKDAAVAEAQEAIDAFATRFETAYAAGTVRTDEDTVLLCHDLILLCVLLCVEDAKSYAERFTLERIVKTQSGHVPVYYRDHRQTWRRAVGGGRWGCPLGQAKIRSVARGLYGLLLISP